MKITLSWKDYLLIRQHLMTDMNYGEQGTFNKIKGTDNIFDLKEAKKVQTILDKMAGQYNKKKKNI